MENIEQYPVGTILEVVDFEQNHLMNGELIKCLGYRPRSSDQVVLIEVDKLEEPYLPEYYRYGYYPWRFERTFKAIVYEASLKEKELEQEDGKT